MSSQTAACCPHGHAFFAAFTDAVIDPDASFDTIDAAADDERTPGPVDVVLCVDASRSSEARAVLQSVLAHTAPTTTVRFWLFAGPDDHSELAQVQLELVEGQARGSMCKHELTIIDNSALVSTAKAAQDVAWDSDSADSAQPLRHRHVAAGFMKRESCVSNDTHVPPGDIP